MREEIRREHEARRFLLELAREAYPWKVTAYKNKVKMMRRKMKLPLKKADWTAEQRKEWNACLLECRKAFEDYLITRLERDIGMRDEGRGMRFLERRSPGGDTQHLAITHVPTTPAGAGYGTMCNCQGRALSGGGGSDTALPKTDCAVVSEANVVGTSDFGQNCVSRSDLRSILLENKLLKEEKKRAREERKAYIKEKYGFRLGKKPETPEEIEGRKQYDRDMDAAMRERRRDKIRVYNREYRRKKRAEALAVEQEKWSSEQWAVYNKKMANKAYPKGSPQWLIKEVVCYLAQIQDLPEDAVTARLIELGGMDFLVKGAESMGRSRCANSGTILAAVRALGLYLDPDGAVMFSRGGDAARDEG